MNNRLLFGVMFLTLGTFQVSAQDAIVKSPDGRLEVKVSCSPVDSTVSYGISYDGKAVLLPSSLGFESNAGDFTDGLTMVSHKENHLSEHYKLSRSKKSDIDINANKLLCTFRNNKGGEMTVEFVVSDNDVAYRYDIPVQGKTKSVRIMDEKSSFVFPDGTTSYLSPQSDPMIGYKRSKPSYEEEYVLDASPESPSKYGRGYTFPCLFNIKPNNLWVLISETGVDSRYCASRMGEYKDGGYKIEFPMPEENNGNGTVEPAFVLPGKTPWRTITVGDNLAPIVETTVVWDVVEPKYEPKFDVKGGRSTWSWILWQDGSCNYDDQVKYIDLASELGYEYVLVDAWWNKNIGYDRMEDLIKYAKSKDVDVFLWYNSGGYWNDIEQTPEGRMDNSIARKKEMEWMRDNGVKGIKVDFFGGDKQETMRLYEDILSDANEYGLMVIFHGCTLPRGWERMYPNYVGSEAVLASENLVFSQHFNNKEACNATLHPFVRNAVGSMEYGGCFMNRFMNKGNKDGIYRTTSDIFQLATTILYQNSIQNFALAPNNLIDAPELCMEYLKAVPTEWDETRLIDGMPGKYVVLARRHNNDWYVAGVNATFEPLNLNLNIDMLAGKHVTLYSEDFTKETKKRMMKVGKKSETELVVKSSDFIPGKKIVKVNDKGTVPVTILPNGGIVIVSVSE